MLIGLKIIFSILIFVFSGGILGKSYAKHKILVILAILVSIIGTAYLGKDICQDFGYCQETQVIEPQKTQIPEPQETEIIEPQKTQVPWVPKITKAPPLPPLSAKFKATPFSSIFKFSFDALSFEDFKKQQAFKARDMFETTAVYQARYAALENRFQEYRQQLANQRQQLIGKYNEAVQTANKDYPVGVVTLTDYKADAGKMSVTLDWQADWIKNNFVAKKGLIKKATISISPNKARALWQSGQEKRLFFKVTGFDNDNEALSGEAVLVDNGRLWVIDKSFIYLSPTNKGKKQLLAMKKQGSLIPAGSFRDRLKDGSQGPEMVSIPAGSFKMGSNNGSSDEKPIHEVSLSAFAIGKYEVTFEEYDKYAQATGKNKPDDRGWGRGNRPVINVSWNDAVDYAEWLSKQTGKKYRLPTEAEWEYAARAGTTTKYWWGNSIGTNKANCRNCGSKWDKTKTAPVGSFAANQFGLHDTVGNVYEWCSDISRSDYYSNSPRSNPTGPGGGETGRARVRRGGAWHDTARNARTADRNVNSPVFRYAYLGFRLLRQP